MSNELALDLRDVLQRYTTIVCHPFLPVVGASLFDPSFHIVELLDELLYLASYVLVICSKFRFGVEVFREAPPKAQVVVVSQEQAAPLATIPSTRLVVLRKLVTASHAVVVNGLDHNGVHQKLAAVVQRKAPLGVRDFLFC
jgi:hypothetical protein